MKASTYFTLLVAVYIAPNLDPKWRTIIAGVCLAAACIALFFKENA